MNGRPSILVVEDDRDTLDVMVSVLQCAGYQAAGASSFEDGRAALAESPDLLITDVRLGAYNGLQLIIRGRAFNPALMAIVVTGYPDAVVRRETERLGALHVEKPVSPERLLHIVSAVLTGSGPTLHS